MVQKYSVLKYLRCTEEWQIVVVRQTVVRRWIAYFAVWCYEVHNCCFLGYNMENKTSSNIAEGMCFLTSTEPLDKNTR